MILTKPRQLPAYVKKGEYMASPEVVQICKSGSRDSALRLLDHYHDQMRYEDYQRAIKTKEYWGQGKKFW